MTTKLLRYFTSAAPKVRRTLWKQWYQLLANWYRKLDWSFMNYGYADLNEKEGCSYVARYLKPKSMKGMDFSINAVNLCKQRYSTLNLTFCHGDAEFMPFDDGSFDFVLNVESSHCYGSMKKFVNEVVRVLKPGGIFSWADFRPKGEILALNRVFDNSGLQQIKENDITLNVIHALDLVNDQKLELIKEHAPKLIQRPFNDFAGVKGTKIYNTFQSREKIYLSKVFKSK